MNEELTPESAYQSWGKAQYIARAYRRITYGVRMQPDNPTSLTEIINETTAASWTFLRAVVKGEVNLPHKERLRASIAALDRGGFPVQTEVLKAKGDGSSE
jgi:hypothetical protein